MIITPTGLLGKLNEVTAVYKVTSTIAVQHSEPINKGELHGPLQVQS